MAQSSSQPGPPRRRSRWGTQTAKSRASPVLIPPPRPRFRPCATSARSWPMTCGRYRPSCTRCGGGALLVRDGKTGMVTDGLCAPASLPPHQHHSAAPPLPAIIPHGAGPTRKSGVGQVGLVVFAVVAIIHRPSDQPHSHRHFHTAGPSAVRGRPGGGHPRQHGRRDWGADDLRSAHPGRGSGPARQVRGVGR